MSTTILQNSQQRLDEVLHLAALGWKVFPVEAISKLPAGSLVRHGFKDATTDPGVIKTWASKKAELNWGIAPPLNVLVLDLDPKSDSHIVTFPGLETLLAANSMSTATPRNGKHIYVKIPEDWRGKISPKIGLIPGLDLRGIDKAYVLAPPSYINKPYQWIGAPVSPDQLLEAPAELLEWIDGIANTKKSSSSTAMAVTSLVYGRGSADKWLKAVVKNVSTTQKGIRHPTLVNSSRSAGGFVAAGRLDQAVVRTDLINAGLQSGLPEKEVVDAVEWGMKTGAQYPIYDAQPAKHKPDGANPSESQEEAIEWMTGADIAASYEPIEWLWGSILPKNTVSILAGAGGVGKSLWVASLELAIASGQGTFLERPIASGAVLHIDVDTDRKLHSPHLQAAAAGLGIDLAECEIFRYTDRLKGPIKEDQLARIKSEIIRLNPVLVVFDSWAACFPNIKSNQSEGVSELLSKLKSLAGLGPSVMVIDHLSKPVANGPDAQSRGPVGSHYKVGGCRSVLIMTEEQSNDKDMVLLHQMKNNLRAKSKDLLIERVWSNEDDDYSKAVTHVLIDNPRFDQSMKLNVKNTNKSRAQASIVKILSNTEGSMNRRTLLDTVVGETGIPEGTVNKALGALVDVKQVEAIQLEGWSNGEKAYRLKR